MFIFCLSDDLSVRPDQNQSRQIRCGIHRDHPGRFVWLREFIDYLFPWQLILFQGFQPVLPAAVVGHSQNLEPFILKAGINLFISGNEARQGRHHEAQKSSNTYLPRKSDKASRLPSGVSSEKSGAGCPGRTRSRIAISSRTSAAIGLFCTLGSKTENTSFNSSNVISFHIIRRFKTDDSTVRFSRISSNCRWRTASEKRSDKGSVSSCNL